MAKVKGSNLERLSREKFGGKTLDWRVSENLGPDLQQIEDGQAWYTNRKGTDIIYVQPKSPEDAKARCYGCDSFILMKVQNNSVWLKGGPGPCAGTGEVINDYVTWCPKCETEPSGSGIVYE